MLDQCIQFGGIADKHLCSVERLLGSISAIHLEHAYDMESPQDGIPDPPETEADRGYKHHRARYRSELFHPPRCLCPR